MRRISKILTAIALLLSYNSYAQIGEAGALKVGDKTYYAAGTDTGVLRGTIINQRTAASVGIGKVLNRIPAKSYQVVLENYAQDNESLNLKGDIKMYLQERGYTNIKTNVHPFYGKDFKYRQCDVAIMDEGGSIILFIPPCPKAYGR